MPATSRRRSASSWRAFAIPTALVALNRADGLAVCDSLNRALGLDRDAWTALAARCLRAAGADSTALH